HRAAARGVVPVEAQRAGPRVVEAAEELAVARREAFVDQRDPRRGQLGLALGRPVERIAVVALLAVLALVAEVLLEELERRRRREELAVARISERALEAHPGERARGAVARRFDRIERREVQILHRLARGGRREDPRRRSLRTEGRPRRFAGVTRGPGAP